MTSKEGLDELRKILISSVDSLVEKEAGKLKEAAEDRSGIGYATSDQDGDAELLVAAGLLSRDGGAEGLHSQAFYYKPTSEGYRVYELIYGKKK